MQVELRETCRSDLDIFFQHWNDHKSNYMAAFTVENPKDRNQFDKHWNDIFENKDIFVKTVIYDNVTAGHILSFLLEGEREVSYWIDRKYWGKGIATSALRSFLGIIAERPLFARTAFDNIGSARVLEKCGFKKIGENKYFANARNKEIIEFIFKLNY